MVQGNQHHIWTELLAFIYCKKLIKLYQMIRRLWIRFYIREMFYKGTFEQCISVLLSCQYRSEGTGATVEQRLDWSI